MRKISILLVLFLAFYQLLNAQSGWVSQYSSVAPSGLRCIRFLNANTGFCCGETGVLLKTTNGGSTGWTAQVTNTGLTLRSLYFTDVNTGYICGDNGIILKSVNGGQNWVNYNGVITETLGSVYFLDANTGFIGGNNGMMLKTTNAGLNWGQMSSSTASAIDEIQYVGTNGYACGQYGAALKTNMGVYWFQLPGFTTTNLTSMYFVDESTGFVAGQDGNVYKTINGGSDFSTFASGYTYFIYGLYFTSASTGYAACYDGRIRKTTNGGVNWTAQVTNIISSLNSVFFINDNTGYACGANGIIIKTTSGGNPVGINNISTNIPEKFDLQQNYPNPFNPTTKIRFDVAPPLSYPNVSIGNTFVTLKIFDALGREVETIVNEKLSPGTYEATFDGSALPSGVYFYKLQAGEYNMTKRMTLLK